MIIRVKVAVVLKRVVVVDRRFDNLSRSHLQGQVKSYCQSLKEIGKSLKLENYKKKMEIKSYLFIIRKGK